MPCYCFCQKTNQIRRFTRVCLSPDHIQSNRSSLRESRWFACFRHFPDTVPCALPHVTHPDTYKDVDESLMPLLLALVFRSPATSLLDLGLYLQEYSLPCSISERSWGPQWEFTFSAELEHLPTSLQNHASATTKSLERYAESVTIFMTWFRVDDLL